MIFYCRKSNQILLYIERFFKGKFYASIIITDLVITTSNLQLYVNEIGIWGKIWTSSIDRKKLKIWTLSIL